MTRPDCARSCHRFNLLSARMAVSVRRVKKLLLEQLKQRIRLSEMPWILVLGKHQRFRCCLSFKKTLGIFPKYIWANQLWAYLTFFFISQLWSTSYDSLSGTSPVNHLHNMFFYVYAYISSLIRTPCPIDSKISLSSFKMKLSQKKILNQSGDQISIQRHT